MSSRKMALRKTAAGRKRVAASGKRESRKMVKPVKKTKESVKKVVKPGKKSAKPVKKTVKFETKPFKKSSVPEEKKTYRDLILEGLKKLNVKKGSSRIALKKYIAKKYSDVYKSGSFDRHFNNAVKKGLESNDLKQPKGPSGTIQINLKKPEKKTKAESKKAAPSKKGKVTKSSTKKTAPVAKKTGKVTKKALSKKTSSPAKDSFTYKEMISEAIKNLNGGKGASRIAVKKYIMSTYFKKDKPAKFINSMTLAIRKGLENEDFKQPKGPAGVLKLNKLKR